MLTFYLPKRRIVVRFVIVLLAASLLSEPAAAAQLPSPIPPSAIRDALQSAWQQHPTYRVTEAQLAASRARLDAAGQPLYNPELEFVADDEGPDRTSTAEVNLTVDMSGKRRARRDAAVARVDQATAEAHIRRRDFVKQWVTSWAELQTAQQRMRIGEQRLGLVTRFASLADKQFAADDISGLERDLAFLARDEAQAEQSQFIAEGLDAEARFRIVGGSPAIVSNLTLPTNILPSPQDIPETDIEQLPDWQAVQANSVATEREVIVARRNRIADPTLGVRAGRVDYGGLKDDVFGVSVTVPLFVRNSYRAEVVAAQAEADVAVAEAERVRIELDADRLRVIEGYATAQSAWSRWKTSRGTDVERRADLLERMWREGELSTADYLLQLKQTLDTALAGAELEGRLWRSYVDYLAVTGQLERWAGLENAP